MTDFEFWVNMQPPVTENDIKLTTAQLKVMLKAEFQFSLPVLWVDTPEQLKERQGIS